MTCWTGGETICTSLTLNGVSAFISVTHCIDGERIGALVILNGPSAFIEMTFCTGGEGIDQVTMG